MLPCLLPSSPRPAVGTSRLLAARVRMQQKYLDQFYDLYEVCVGWVPRKACTALLLSL